MSPGNGIQVADERRLLAERVAASSYLNRSARLRDLLLYLTTRAVEEPEGEIHEQEVGRKVFGRPADYDTSSDNIVRVHASMLRKRLEQYFANEGAGETTVIEIPKGNYAPVFRDRSIASAPAPRPLASAAVEARTHDRRIPILFALVLLFAASTAFLLVRQPSPVSSSAGPTVRLFWAQIFHAGHPTDVVLDDAAVTLYQELTGRSLSLSEYFDRSYQRNLPDSKLADIALKRQSSFASVSFLWRLYQMPGVQPFRAAVRFARDYSFRDLKADDAVLIGNSHSNPWMEPFDPKLGIRWQFDKATGVYYPEDIRPSGKNYSALNDAAGHEGYFSIALLPNLGGTGNVLLVSGTGGSALAAAADFLADEHAVSGLHSRLSAGSDRFPPFEALVKIKGRRALPGEAEIAVLRPL